MRFWNSGKGESNVLQNQFTRYLKTAVQRKKIDVLRERKNIYGHEHYGETWQELLPLITEDVYFRFSLQCESIDLDQILRQVEKRDRYIFYAHILDERTFAELAAELGMSYKGVAAAYYRVIRKIRAMRGDEHGFQGTSDSRPSRRPTGQRKNHRTLSAAPYEGVRSEWDL